MLLRPPFDPQKPTALFSGRYQPFHGGHQRLIEEGLCRVGHVCIALHDRARHRSEKSAALLRCKKAHRRGAISACRRFVVVPLPNITNAFYGRDVGDSVERIVLDEEAEAISATKARNIF
jgi:nicotinamide mononucleotide adenylyltransferase